MVKVKKVFEHASGAKIEYKKMKDSGYFDKLEKKEVGTRGYVKICAFSFEKAFVVKANGWPEGDNIVEEELFKDEDFTRMYPAPKEKVAGRKPVEQHEGELSCNSV